MPTPPRHLNEELDALLDGRLDAAAHAEAEAHLAACERCQREFAALRWTRELVATRLTAPQMPADLREKIAHSLRAEIAREVVITPPRAVWSRRTFALASAAVLVFAAVLAGLFIRRAPTLPVVVAEDFRAYRAGQLALEHETGDVKDMEAFFADHGVTFPTRVFDLGMMNYQLVGGRTQRADGGPRALFVYRGPHGEELLCQMFAGKTSTLPAGAERRENKGFVFHIYRRGRTTAVFWQEGAVVCVLVSDIAAEEVVQLAFAKAMTP